MSARGAQPTGDHDREDRGQSAVLGMALLFGITAAGVTLVVMFGGGALSQSQGAVSANTAEHAMMEFDSRASLVAHGDSQTKRAQFSSGTKSSVGVRSDAGWINVTVYNETTGELKTRVMNATLGAVVAEQGGTTIAYQGGGVWQASDGGSTVVSPPELHYRGTTLTMPLVTVRGDNALTDRVKISGDGAPVPKYPNVSAGRTNPLREGQVNVTIHSEYYRAWGAFFHQRFDADVNYDHDDRLARIRLLVPEESTNTVDTALSSAAPDGDLVLSGSGNYPAYTDSYNSSKGNYTATKSGNGTISTSGNVEVSGNARVNGSIKSGGTVSLSGTSKVHDYVYWTTGFSASGGAEYEGEEHISGVSGKSPITTKVRNKVDEVKASNDNGGTTAIENARLDYDGGDSLTLSDGTYYLEKIDLDDKDLTIETNGQEVVIGVENSLKLDNGANITVKGTGVVRLYAKGDLGIKKDSSVHVPGERSERFWFYGTEESELTIEGSNSQTTRFVGVIYAPSEGGNADLSVKHAQIYGSIVAGGMDVGTGGAIHYDQALRTAEPFPDSSDIPKVTYLHVSVNRVNVTDA